MSWLTLYTGKDRSRPPRPSQNPLSSFKSPICEIHWVLVRRRNRYARHKPARRRSRAIQRPFSNPATHLPLRRHKIPCLRASALSPHTLFSARNPPSPPLFRFIGRHDLRLSHLPTRSYPGAPRLRNQKGLPLQPQTYLQPNLPRAPILCLPHLYRPNLPFQQLKHNNHATINHNPKNRPSKLLPRLLPDISRHAALRGDVLPYPRHRNRLPPSPCTGTLHNHPVPKKHLRPLRPTNPQILGPAPRRRFRRSSFPNLSLPSRSHKTEDASWRGSGGRA